MVGIELGIVAHTIFVELSNITGSEPPLTPFFKKRCWAANAVQDLAILSKISLNQTTQKYILVLTYFVQTLIWLLKKYNYDYLVTFAIGSPPRIISPRGLGLSITLYSPSSQSTSLASTPAIGFPAVSVLKSEFSITVPVQVLSVKLYPWNENTFQHNEEPKLYSFIRINEMPISILPGQLLHLSRPL